MKVAGLRAIILMALIGYLVPCGFAQDRDKGRIGFCEKDMGSMWQSAGFEATAVNAVSLERAAKSFAGVTGYLVCVNHKTDSDVGYMLPKIEKFVQTGGRACIIVTPEAAEANMNQVFRELFAVSVGLEYVVPPSPQFSLPGENLCTLWKGLRVGSNYGTPALKVYLTPAGEGWQVTRIASKASGKERILSAHRKLGQGEILIIAALEVSWDWGRWGEGWFTDNSFSVFDNDKASVALYSWLAGLTDYPIPEPAVQPASLGNNLSTSSTPQDSARDNTAVLNESLSGRIADLERQVRDSQADKDLLRRELEALRQQGKLANTGGGGMTTFLTIVAGGLFLTTIVLLWRRYRAARQAPPD